MSDQARTAVHRGPIDASPPPRDSTQVRIAGGRALTGLAILLGWFLLYALVFSGFEQHHAQHRLYGELRAQLAEGTAPMGAPIAAGAPVAVLEIPAIDLAPQVVVEGTRSRALQDGPGHLAGTVLPGQQGVSVVAGRSASFGAPFGRLPELRGGDSVIVTTGQGRFVYLVTGVRVAGDPVPRPLAAGAGRLTLVTAAGSGSRISRLQPGHTLYVDAELQEAAAAGPRAAPERDLSLLGSRVDRTSLAELALSLQLLIVVLVAVVWAWSRWSRRAAWITGVPTALAALWTVSSLVARFLPALI